MTQVIWLDEETLDFPPSTYALDDPNGLIAVGGDLSTQRLIKAYRLGIFPWYNQDEPILWWTPTPRCVLKPSEVHVSRSLRKLLRQKHFDVTFNRCFSEVIGFCAKTRAENEGTWINTDMQAAYLALHHQGVAQSVEVWHDGRLVGGLYGVVIGRVFFGESMFSLMSNASKAGFVHLCEQLSALDFTLIDCQVPSEHLYSLGAKDMDRAAFERNLHINRKHTDTPRL